MHSLVPVFSVEHYITTEKLRLFTQISLVFTPIFGCMLPKMFLKGEGGSQPNQTLGCYLQILLLKGTISKN